MDEMKNNSMEYVDVLAPADILEGEDAVTIWFEVPGASSKTVDVEVRNRILSVSAESALRRGGRPVRYQREFQLSDVIDVEKITAETKDGVLTLTLPKSEQAKVHKIKVS